MTEEQRNLTLGQVADMKKEMERKVKDLLIDFIEKTGCMCAEVCGSIYKSKRIAIDDTIEYTMDGNVTLAPRMFND